MITRDSFPYALTTPATETATAPGSSAGLAVIAAALQRGGEALQELRVEDAIDDYRRVLQADPDNFYALANIGIALTRVGITDQALRALHRASMMRPPTWEAFQVLSAWTRFAERQAEGNFRRSTATAPPRFVVWLLERLARRTAAPDAPQLVPMYGPTGPGGHK